ncbi:MAG: TetR/AcrR family transcriptional regulator [Methylobacterium sp.]|uniref:TetR/AcrR family transcriptional regulator n=1 Tax=Methylobacterium sp. TaxID=409 RepID=UPI00258EE522|nr:TetR/AcrR family transcriptional regulator [Methylobacterium sp.]MBY0299605.1 TetR/AcrR family transcriptional regulator [Methylobacterium sp.]
MTRSRGARNRDYEEQRLALAGRLRERLGNAGGAQPSLAELAKAAGVSVATLRHYFGDRDGLVAAVLELHGAQGTGHLAVVRQPSGPFAASVGDAAAYLALGLSQPVVRELHALGLSEGLGHPRSGPAYLAHTLEPLVQALEDRFRAHIAAGEMREADPRAAALALAAPLLLAHLHQDRLGGTAVRPLDLDRFRAEHVEAFVRAYGR